MMLVTVPELALWAEGDSAAIDPLDPLALWILERASELVMFHSGQPEWTPATALPTAKVLVANVAKRCWNNPDQEVRSAIAGGPSSAVIDEAAFGLALTDAEIAECAKMTPAALEPNAGGFWSLSLAGIPQTNRVYAPDSRWPQSSPINWISAKGDPEYMPTLDEPLPLLDPALEPTNTPVEDIPSVI